MFQNFSYFKILVYKCIESFFSLNSRYVIIVCDDSILNFSTECQPNQISCDTDRCIDVSFLCDGYSDCEDTTDEAQCGTCASCSTS